MIRLRNKNKEIIKAIEVLNETVNSNRAEFIKPTEVVVKAREKIAELIDKLKY